MNSTSTPALTMPEFNAAGVNLATLGLNPANPLADRVRDGLTALRTKALTKATSSPMRIKQTMPGLTPADAKQLAHAINNKQLADGMGAAGKKVAMAMLHQVDNVGGMALELFERRRMQRQGLRPRAIETAIKEMKADGRIPATKEGGASV